MTHGGHLGWRTCCFVPPTHHVYTVNATLAVDIWRLWAGGHTHSQQQDHLRNIQTRICESSGDSDVFRYFLGGLGEEVLENVQSKHMHKLLRKSSGKCREFSACLKAVKDTGDLWPACQIGLIALFHEHVYDMKVIKQNIELSPTPTVIWYCSNIHNHSLE